MFTGIVEERGIIRRIDRGRLSAKLYIQAHKVLEDVKLGDSIAVNGICLTVTDYGMDSFTVDAMPETMNRTNLGELHAHEQVHLERAMALGGRFGGHMVTGHIDGVGILRKKEKDEIAIRLTVDIPAHMKKYILSKGSIAIDGVSLTVIQIYPEGFQVGIIPKTGEDTLLLKKELGCKLNIECDLIGKYVEQLCTPNYPKDQAKTKESKIINQAYLMEKGFL